MSEHVLEYIGTQTQRLRAERAESLVRTWRITSWVFGAVLTCLLAVILGQERQLVLIREYAALADEDAYRHSSKAAELDDVRALSERKFRTCLAANAGLVEALGEFDLVVKGQQQVIRETLELAKRCDVQPSSLWAFGLSGQERASDR